MRKVAVLLLCALSSPLLSQDNPQTRAGGAQATSDKTFFHGRLASQQQGMRSLDYLIGNWEGSGWLEVGGKRQEFRGTQAIYNRLNRSTLLFEGSLKLDGPDGKSASFDSLGVLAFDSQSNSYRFHAFTNNGRSGMHEATLIDGSLQWGFNDDRGQTIRYTFRLTKDQELSSVGERSGDGGKIWQKFFEAMFRRCL